MLTVEYTFMSLYATICVLLKFFLGEIVICSFSKYFDAFHGKSVGKLLLKFYGNREKYNQKMKKI